MKVALCLSGISVGKNTIGNTPSTQYGTQWKSAFESIRKNIIEPNACDVFFHTWANDELPELVKEYKPVAFSTEPVKMFNPEWNFEKFSMHEKSWKAFMTDRFPPLTYAQPKSFSQAYSIMYADRLRQLHEMMMETKYDFVIRCRFDLEFYAPIIFTDYSPNNVYFAEWQVHPWGMDDVFFAGSSDNMKAICSLYDFITTYLTNSEYDSYTRERRLGANNLGSTLHELLFYHLNKSDLLPNAIRKWNNGTDFKIKRT